MHLTLQHRQILIAEDEFFLADELSRLLEEQGAIIIGPASSVENLSELVEEEAQIDAAVLDMNLRGEMSLGAADALLARGVPVVFATGYDPIVIPERYAAIPRIIKPYEHDHIVQLLVTLLPAG